MGLLSNKFSNQGLSCAWRSDLYESLRKDDKVTEDLVREQEKMKGLVLESLTHIIGEPMITAYQGASRIAKKLSGKVTITPESFGFPGNYYNVQKKSWEKDNSMIMRCNQPLMRLDENDGAWNILGLPEKYPQFSKLWYYSIDLSPDLVGEDLSERIRYQIIALLEAKFRYRNFLSEFCYSGSGGYAHNLYIDRLKYRFLEDLKPCTMGKLYSLREDWFNRLVEIKEITELDMYGPEGKDSDRSHEIDPGFYEDPKRTAAEKLQQLNIDLLK